MFDPTRVPPASLEGLEEYSHIWIIYLFHLNTDLDKLWLEPSRSKIKAKVCTILISYTLLFMAPNIVFDKCSMNE